MKSSHNYNRGEGGQRAGGRGGRDGQRGGRGGFSNQYQAAKTPKCATPVDNQQFNVVSNIVKVQLGSAKHVHFYGFELMNQTTDVEEQYNAIHSAKNQIKSELGNFWTLNSRQLFSFRRVDKEFIVESTSEDGQNFFMKISYQETYRIDEVRSREAVTALKSLSMGVLKSKLQDKNFLPIGKLQRFYDPSSEKALDNLNLIKWTGFSLDSNFYSLGPSVTIDSCTKFVNATPISILFEQMREAGKSQNEIKFFFIDRQRKKSNFTVKTSWGEERKAYVIDDIDFVGNPDQIFFDRKDKQTGDIQSVSMRQYFEQTYKKVLRKGTQPILIVNRRGQKIHLPADLCFNAQLPADFTKDFKKMRELQSEKTFDPETKFRQIEKLVSSFNDSSAMDIDDPENVEIVPELMTLKGFYARQPMLTNGKLVKTAYSSPFASKVDIRNEEWALIYDGSRDYRLASEVFETFQRESRSLGMEVGEPQWIEMTNSTLEQLQSAAQQIQRGVKIAFVILQNKNLHDKAKESIYTHARIPSQFALQKTLLRGGRLDASLAKSLLKQMNSKLGGDLYRLKLTQAQGLMAIGVDAVNFQRGHIFAVSSTYTKDLTQCYTQTENIQLEGDMLNQPQDSQNQYLAHQTAEFLSEALIKAIDFYSNKNNSLPAKIILYRDAVGGPQFEQLCTQIELPIIKDTVKGIYGSALPDFIYTLLNQKMNQRFFYDHNGTKINPGPGSIVESGIQRPENGKANEFFMIPHSATVATARPVHYATKFKHGKISKEDFQQLTFELCYNYFNFGGGIKVPSVCKYAEKAAQHAHDVFGAQNVPKDVLAFL